MNEHLDKSGNPNQVLHPVAVLFLLVDLGGDQAVSKSPDYLTTVSLTLRKQIHILIVRIEKLPYIPLQIMHNKTNLKTFSANI